jgi:hypothetical protein
MYKNDDLLSIREKHTLTVVRGQFRYTILEQFQHIFIELFFQFRHFFLEYIGFFFFLALFLFLQRKKFELFFKMTPPSSQVAADDAFFKIKILVSHERIRLYSASNSPQFVLEGFVFFF